MSDIPGEPGDGLEPDDDSRFDDDSESQDSNSESSKKDQQPDGIGEDHPDYAGALFLSSGDSEAVLNRIVDGDPLGIQERCSAWTRKRFYLIDFERMMMRTMAMIAHTGRKYRGQVPFNDWVFERIDASADQLMEEEVEQERTGAPVSQPYSAHYEVVANIMGMTPEDTRPGCIRFNQLPLPPRRAFFDMCIDGLSLNRFVAEGNGPPKRAKAHLKRAFQALAYRDPETGFFHFDPPDDFKDLL